MPKVSKLVNGWIPGANVQRPLTRSNRSIYCLVDD